MTTFELKRSILQYINALMDDEAAMRRISRYIRRLRNSTSTKDVAHEDMIELIKQKKRSSKEM